MNREPNFGNNIVTSWSVGQPNATHFAIAGLAQHIPKLTVVTQNVDDLHERAGSAEVLHLHGSLHSPRCFACGRPHALSPDVPDEPDGGRKLHPPSCIHCGGSIRPGVVWFGEDLPASELDRAFAATKACDALFAIGTSGLVQPAARIPLIAKQSGASVVEVNPTNTGLDGQWTWSLRGAAGEVMPSLAAPCRGPHDGG